MVFISIKTANALMRISTILMIFTGLLATLIMLFGIVLNNSMLLINIGTYIFGITALLSFPAVIGLMYSGEISIGPEINQA